MTRHPTRRPLAARRALAGLRSLPSVRLAAGLALAALTTALGACTDAELAAPGTMPGLSVIAPRVVLAGAEGAGAGAARTDALSKAFDRVDAFRMRIVRTSGEVAKDTVIPVEPGRDAYTLEAPVRTTVPREVFTVTITALDGNVVLFESQPIQVEAVPPGETGGGSAPTIQLVYTGPGAGATEISLTPTRALLGRGGTTTLEAAVTDGAGQVVEGVPVGFESSAPSVAAVDDDGVVTADLEGLAVITATTPTGLEATATVYVAGGTAAWVSGGHVWVGDLVDGTAEDRTPDAVDAHQPAWSPGGGLLVYVDQGRILSASGDTLTEGAWPAVSPDGTKLALERSGTVWFSNADGTHPTEGPGGSQPRWRSTTHLVVTGGSVQTVKADGTDRATVVQGVADRPAVSSDGRLAWIEDGTLLVEGVGAVAGGVVSRASWSPGGTWLLTATGDGLVLVPSDGSAEPVPLGIDGTDPAWRPGGGAASPPAPEIEALEPDPAIPGSEVRLVGEGFDWIIPANNTVQFPGPDGPVEGEVRGVDEAGLDVLMPRGLVAGDIVATTPFGQASIFFEPAFGAIEVRATRPGGEAFGQLTATLRRGGEVEGEGEADAEGVVDFGPLEPGRYDLHLSVPFGFVMDGPATRTVQLGAELHVVEVEVRTTPIDVTVTPAPPLTLEVGDAVEVTARAFDINGEVIPSFGSIDWVGGPNGRIEGRGHALTGTLYGARPSSGPEDAPFAVVLDGEVFEFPATVTTWIEGTLTRSDGSGRTVPASGVSVALLQKGEIVALETSNGEGQYRFGGIFAGSYTVRPNPAQGLSPQPSERFFDLDLNNTTARADFHFAASNAVYEWSFESGLEGWSLTGLWNRTTGAGISNVAVGGNAQLPPGDTSGGALPPAPFGSYYLWYGDPAQGNFDVGTSSGTATSPAITLPQGGGWIGVTTYFEIEGVSPTGFDQMYIEVVDLTAGNTTILGLLNPTQNPGGGGSNKTFTSAGMDQPAVFVERGFLVPSGMGGHDAMVRLRFDSDDGLYNYWRGWIVDRVQVGTGSPPFTPYAPADLDGLVLDLVPAGAASGGRAGGDRWSCEPAGCEPEGRPDRPRRDGVVPEPSGSPDPGDPGDGRPRRR